MADVTLAAIVRQKVETGLLPREHPSGVECTEGTGLRCSVCEQGIPRGESQLAFTRAESFFRFHLACWIVWLASLV